MADDKVEQDKQGNQDKQKGSSEQSSVNRLQVAVLKLRIGILKNSITDNEEIVNDIKANPENAFSHLTLRQSFVEMVSTEDRSSERIMKVAENVIGRITNEIEEDKNSVQELEDKLAELTGGKKNQMRRKRKMNSKKIIMMIIP